MISEVNGYLVWGLFCLLLRHPFAVPLFYHVTTVSESLTRDGCHALGLLTLQNPKLAQFLFHMNDLGSLCLFTATEADFVTSSAAECISAAKVENESNTHRAQPLMLQSRRLEQAGFLWYHFRSRATHPALKSMPL